MPQTGGYDTESALTCDQRRLRELELLVGIAGELLRAPDPQRVIESLCHQVMQHLDCQLFFNYIADPQAGSLRLNACAGISPDAAEAIRTLSYGSAVCGCVAQEGRRIVAERIPKVQDVRTDLVRSYGVQAYACHPLLGKDNEILGTLSFGTRTREAFSEDDLSLMKAVSEQVALALTRVRQERALRESEARFRIASEAMDAIFYDYDLATQRVTRTAGLERLLGFDLHEVSDAADWWVQRVHPDDAASIAGFTEAVQRRAENVATEYRVRHKDGRWIWVWDQARVEYDGSGNPCRLRGCTVSIDARKHAEEALRRSEDRQRLAQAAAGIGIHEFDPHTGQIEWDAKAHELWGLEPGQPVTYDLFREGLHPDDRASTDHAVARALDPKGDGVYRTEYRVINRRDGRQRWILATGHVTFAEGKPVRLLGTVQDISDRREAEEALRVSEANFRAFIESLPSLAWTCRPDGYCDYLNPQWEAYTGVTAEPQLGSGWLAAVHMDDRERLMHAWNRSVETGQQLDVEFRIRNSEGMPRWFQTRAIPLRKDGKIIKWFGVNTDIHDLKITQQALTDSEARFRQLADSIPQLAWITDETGWIFWYNQRWFDYTGTTLDEVQGWGWRSVHHPDHVERVVAKFTSSFRDGRVWEDTFPIRGRDGEYRWFLSRAIPIRDERGRIVRWFGTNTDITEQRIAAGRLEEANRAKDQFLAIVSHELRTPLNNISMWAQFLSEGKPGQEESQQGLGEILDNVRFQTRLIDDLLDVSRIISGKLETERQRLDLSDVVKNAASAARGLARQKQVQFDVKLAEVEHAVLGDRGRLTQVVSNLLNNAIKFTPSGGRVELSVHRQDGSAEIRVKDTGEGIASHVLPHIFDRFRQADSSTTRRHGGLGLGLSIVKHLVEMHGGRVSVHSDGPGSGAAFRVTLPLIADAPSGARTAEAPRHDGAPVQLTGVRVLVVDDEGSTRELIKRILELRGADVAMAASANEAMELLSVWPAQMLLSDIAMPDQDGFDLIRRVRGIDRGKQLRTVALTAFARPEDRERCRQAGFDGFLTKPIDANQLIALLADLVRPS